MQKIKKLGTRDIIVISLLLFISIILAGTNPVLGHIYFLTLVFIYMLLSKKILDLRLDLISLKRIFKYWLVSLAANMFFGVFLQKAVASKNQEIIVETIKSGGLEAIKMILIVTIFAPIIEEILFRGMIQESLNKINKRCSLIITSILFASMHLISSWSAGRAGVQMLLELVPYLTLSFIIAYYYYKTDNLWHCMVLHFLNNGFAFLMFLISQFIKI